MSTAAHHYCMPSLYVGDLHPDVTESLLFDTFETIGTIISIRVCRDVNTRRSLGYAYVNFQQHVDAARVLDTMNFEAIKGRPMRIMWSRRDPSLRRSGIGNVFIKNLEKNINTKDLYNIFYKFDNILSCKIIADENGSKGYGFVHLETGEAALKAIEKLHGTLLSGKKVYVGHFIPRRERLQSPGDQDNKFTNVYVKNFSDKLDDEKLRQMFEKFGKIASAKVMTDESGKSKGFGFVNFEAAKSAESAVSAINGMEIDGRQIYAGRSQKKAVRQAELKEKFGKRSSELINLYVKNLHDDIYDERLRNEFSRFGTITSAKVMMDNGLSKGFGFVCLSTPEEARSAIDEMNDYVLDGKPLYVDLAQKKEERTAQLKSLYAQRKSGLSQTTPPMAPLSQLNTFGYYVPTLSLDQRYYPSKVQQLRAGPDPRWQTVRPTTDQQAAAYQPMDATPQIRPHRLERAQTGIHNNLNFQPITGQTNDQRVAAPQTVTGRPQNHMRMRPPVPSAASAGMQPMFPPSQAHAHTQQHNVAVHKKDHPASSMLTAASKEQERMLGDSLYPLISSMYPDYVAKITGMFLEMDHSQLMHMMVFRESLRAKVEEFRGVIEEQAKEAVNPWRQ